MSLGRLVESETETETETGTGIGIGTGAFEEFGSRSETVRLSAGLDQTGRLADDRINAAIETVTRFAQEARTEGAERLIGVATDAVRVAENGLEFLDRLQRETGVLFSVISGDREAELTFRGLAASIDLSGDILIADIGGGSTELISAADGAVRRATSIPLGSGRLTDRLVRHDPPTNQEIAACRAMAWEQLTATELPNGPDVRLIAVGGAGEYLMGLLPPDRPVRPAAIDTVLDRLAMIPAATLTTMLPISEARAHVLPAGIAIVGAIADRVSPSSIEAARSGIRAGLLLAAFAGEV